MRPELSVVMPAYNEEANIGAAITRTVEQLEGLGLSWELILVDDGSQDLTFARMREAAGSEPRLRVLRLSRNFGSHIAITAGLEHARGSACLVITSDLEEPAEKIPDFIRLWRSGYEIVWGIRTARREPLTVRVSSGLFHTLFRVFGLTGYYRQAIGGGFFLVDRRVVDVLRRLKERNRTVVGLLSWLGFSQATLAYEPVARGAGRSKWTFGRRLKLAIDSFVAFSYVPIRLVSALPIYFHSRGQLHLRAVCRPAGGLRGHCGSGLAHADGGGALSRRPSAPGQRDARRIPVAGPGREQGAAPLHRRGGARL